MWPCDSWSFPLLYEELITEDRDPVLYLYEGLKEKNGLKFLKGCL